MVRTKGCRLEKQSAMWLGNHWAATMDWDWVEPTEKRWATHWEIPKGFDWASQ